MFLSKSSMSTAEYDNYYYNFFFGNPKNRSKTLRFLWKRNNFSGLFEKS